MNFQDLKAAVIEAFGQRDYDRCFSILDKFIDTAAGEDLGNGLILKAEVIARADCRRSAEALALLDEAVRHLPENPGATLGTFIVSLWLCNVTGDVERAATYEARGHRLIQEHGDTPDIKANRFRFYSNLGSVARTKGDYATAYWHFMQATRCLLADGADDEANLKTSLFWLYLPTSDACLHMGRLPEAQEALDKAEPLAATELMRIHLTVARGELFRTSGRSRQAALLLEQLGAQQPDSWPPDTLARYHLEKAQVAQALGDLRSFHQHMASAQKVAIEHSLDCLLCEIQRVQRAPVSN